MFEYKATVVGPLSSLRREKKVEDAGVSLADAYTAALNHYGSQGWKLHSVVAISSPINRAVPGPLVLLVFEKYILEYPADITDPNYNSSNRAYETEAPPGYTVNNLCCRCHNPQVAETDGGESA